MKSLPLLYRDQWLVAVNKPPGLLVHRSAVDRHETRFALQMVRDQIGRRLFPVHRLDKPTSGVLLFALESEVARRLGEAFASGRVRKRYLAVVRGHPEPFRTIEHPLQEPWDRMTDRRARRDKPPQPAVTDIRRLATCELPLRVDRYPTSRYALVEASPRTGRKHQIRRHLKHISHPIIGDTTYGKGRHNRLFSQRFGADRLLLHAVELALPHPTSGEELVIQAPLEERFQRTVEALGWCASLPLPREEQPAPNHHSSIIQR
ncbi:MAG: tRNA pseudouridine(65) synthase TruC [Gammaproteobacteria bacterium]